MTRALTLLRRRLVGSVFVLLIVVIGSFPLLEAAPGDAVDAYI
ncbi:MAG: ABC transporter permease, partial [Mesorhizobium sp.]